MARKMKDSGIEWIGEIPEGWEVATIGHLFSVTAGGDAKPHLYSYVQDAKHPYPVYTNSSNPNQIYAYTSAPKFNENTITVTGRGDIGHAFYRNTKFDAIIRLLVLAPKSALDCRYYAYWIDNVSIFFTNSAAVGQLSAQQIFPYKTCYLPLCEQQSIANHLDFYCSEIEHILADIQNSIQEYKKLKQAVITQAVTKGVRGEREMRDSGVEWIGEINHSFSLIKLKYICSILDQYRKPISADKRSQTGSVLYDYYGASGAIDKIDDYTIDDHVMLIGEDGANLRMRNLPLMYEVNGKAWINNHAHILKPTERVDFYYLFYALEGLDINPYITGSAQPKLSQEKLQNIWVPLPDFEEQQEIATYIRSKCAEIDELIAKKEQLVKELENYKKSLIFEYVTGKKELRR